MRLGVLFVRKLLFGENIADGPKISAWRKEIAEKIVEKEKKGEIPEPEKFMVDMIRWALVENENTGSYQRIQCPIQLKGSGRWCARDHGGRYRLLRDVIYETVEQIYGQKRASEMAVEFLLGETPKEFKSFQEDWGLCTAYILIRRYAEKS
ncbi:MAG: hypothetical protein NZ893_02810 [Candidatus Aenigmarchaeota archaeon]|nr:hypothetical protein [Candidatus Aenigmarchaeota archaeon]